MAITDLVKYDQPQDAEFVWKFPSEDLKLGAQVVVNQSQEAVFVKGGEVLDILTAGTHTLSTGNLPFLNRLINFPFGGNTPFTAEVWYVNKIAKRDLKWGTPAPIPIRDQVLSFPVSVRSFGKWGARIADTRSFLIQIVGSQYGADAQKINDYFIGEIIQKLTETLSNAITHQQISILDLQAAITQLSLTTKEKIEKDFDRFGLEVVNFNIENINIPQEEMSQIQEVFAKTLEARELSKVEVGGAYTAIKSFEVLNTAAENPGEGSGLGAMLGAGIGLGAGLPIGQQIGQSINVQGTGDTKEDSVARLQKLKLMLDEGLITEDQFTAKRSEILGDL
jgi:membrane protease subunit (stomatin/prohibitin family)